MIPLIDLREAYLREIQPKPRLAYRFPNLTASQWGKVAAYTVVAICIAPVIFATLWAFGVLLGTGIICVCIFRAVA